MPLFSNSGQVFAGPGSVAPAEDDYLTWNKGEARALSPHFGTQEFTCHCSYSDCPTQRVSKLLIYLLEKLREDVGMPLSVTSGFRCEKYQAHLRNTLPDGHTAAGKSTHELGHAADITCSGLAVLKSKAPAHFLAIGDAPTFIHVDLRKDKRRAWKYA